MCPQLKKELTDQTEAVNVLMREIEQPEADLSEPEPSTDQTEAVKVLMREIEQPEADLSKPEQLEADPSEPEPPIIDEFAAEVVMENTELFDLMEEFFNQISSTEVFQIMCNL